MNKFKELISLIESASQIGLITHERGDADAFASVLVLADLLQGLGKETLIFSNEKIPDWLNQLAEDFEYNPKGSFEKIDLLICLDANSPERLTLPEIFADSIKNIPVAVLDHHHGGDFSQFKILHIVESNTSSTGELVYELADALSIKLNKKQATGLYLALMADTGSLQFTNTSSKTMVRASALLNVGAQKDRVIETLSGGQRSIENSKLLGEVLQRLRLNKKYGISTTYITQKDLRDAGLDESFSSGVANILDQTKEGKIVMVLMETKEGKIKVSIRANRSKANVAKLAEIFGGGGHPKAAGFTFEGNLKELLG